MNIALLIAGGSGNRMGQDIPKQFMHVDGCPIIIHTMKCFQRHPDIDSIAVVCLKGWETVLQAYANQFCIDKLKWIFPGGTSGMESIYNKAQKYLNQDNKYCACIVNGLYGKGEVRPIKWATDLVLMPFGTRSLPVPSTWDAYLKGVYGDYMTPPPVEKRKRHSSTPACLLIDEE